MGLLEKAYKAPSWKGVTADSEALSSKDLKERWYVIYFYPKDMTPGCTREAQDFQKALKHFEKLGCAVIGVSKDSCERHTKFSKAEGLKFALLSDEEGTVCEAFEVWKEKLNYGKKYMGIERSTFLVDDNSKVVAEWRKVRVDGHVEQVLSVLRSCQKAAKA